uniref:Uncharacterized protein n=1 Tax=Anopheles christyi TaxID=43041 RepID=A0A182KIK3_9DIPT
MHTHARRGRLGCGDRGDASIRAAPFTATVGACVISKKYS